MTVNDFADIESWATHQWGSANLGDQRRTRRAVRVGAALTAQPAASLPTQLGPWKDLKAAYRLFGEADVSHRALGQPHWELTRRRAAAADSEVVLFIQDTSELDFTAHPQTAGLGHIGKPWGRGMLLHSCLAVLPIAESRQVLGLAAQRVWARQHPPYKGREKRSEKLKRAEKESGVWAEIIAELGPQPGALRGRRWVSVGIGPVTSSRTCGAPWPRSGMCCCARHRTASSRYRPG